MAVVAVCVLVQPSCVTLRARVCVLLYIEHVCVGNGMPWRETLRGSVPSEQFSSSSVDSGSIAVIAKQHSCCGHSRQSVCDKGLCWLCLMSPLVLSRRVCTVFTLFGALLIVPSGHGP